MQKLLLLLFILCSLVIAQQKPKVVIGATGEEPKPGIRKGLETQIKIAFVKDGRYTATTREEAVLSQMGKEHAYQRSGAVDENQIKQLGKQSGAKYMCIVEISELMDSYTLDAQLVDIETADIIGIGSVLSNLKNSGDFLAASEALVDQLLDYSHSSKGNNYGSGIFFDEDGSNANPVATAIIKVLKQKVDLSDGTCTNGAKAAVESDDEPLCSEGIIGIACKANVQLIITQCKGGKKAVFKGSIIGVDKYSESAANKQMMRNIEKADFWKEWVKELEKRSK